MILGYLALNDLTPQHNDLHRRLFSLGLQILETVATTAPTRDTLPVGCLQVYQSGATVRMYHNLNNVLYYWAMTAA